MAIDPQNVDALVSLARCRVFAATVLWLSESDELLGQAKDAVGRALPIDPRNARALLVKSLVLAYCTEFGYRGQIQEAIDAAESAIALDHNLSGAYRWLGRLYSKAGRPERTAALVRQEMRLSPRDPDAAASLYNICTAELQMRRYSAAISTFRKSVAENPSLAISWANLTAAYLAAGREPEARDTLSEVQKTRRAPGTGSAR